MYLGSYNMEKLSGINIGSLNRFIRSSEWFRDQGIADNCGNIMSPMRPKCVSPIFLGWAATSAYPSKYGSFGIFCMVSLNISMTIRYLNSVSVLPARRGYRIDYFMMLVYTSKKTSFEFSLMHQSRQCILSTTAELSVRITAQPHTLAVVQQIVCWLIRRKARVRATGQTLKQNTKSISSAFSSQQISGKNSESK